MMHGTGTNGSMPAAYGFCHYCGLCVQAPPDHTRRDSWELAWQEEQQEAQQQQQPANSTTASVSAAAGQCGMSLAAARNPGSQVASQAVATAQAASAGAGTARLLAPAAPAAAGSSAAHSPGSVELSSVTSAAATAAAGAPAAGPKSAPAPSSSNKGRQNMGRENTQAADDYTPYLSQLVVQQKAPEVAAAAKADAVERMLAAESAQVPLVPAALLVVMFLAVLLTSLLSKQAPCGSAVYWMVQWAVAPILMGVFWYSRRRVLAKVALKKQAQLDFHGEVRWTSRKVGWLCHKASGRARQGGGSELDFSEDGRL